MRATLREQSWLKVVHDVEIGDGLFAVEYDGRGMGYESVYVNEQLAARVTDC